MSQAMEGVAFVARRCVVVKTGSVTGSSLKEFVRRQHRCQTVVISITSPIQSRMELAVSGNCKKH
jgi:hypothetical protein